MNLNPDPAADVDDLIAADEAEEQGVFEYGQSERKDMWYSPWEYDGREILKPRRPELTGDKCDALMSDLSAWVEWLVITFRIQSRIPPCWVRHGGMREELLALFFFWQHSWIPALDPSLPVAFMREFDWAMGRIDRYWKVPCDNTEHKDPAAVNFVSTGIPDWKAFWANPDYNDSELAVAQLRSNGRPQR